MTAAVPPTRGWSAGVRRFVAGGLASRRVLPDRSAHTARGVEVSQNQHNDRPELINHFFLPPACFLDPLFLSLTRLPGDAFSSSTSPLARNRRDVADADADHEVRCHVSRAPGRHPVILFPSTERLK